MIASQAFGLSQSSGSQSSGKRHHGRAMRVGLVAAALTLSGCSHFTGEDSQPAHHGLFHIQHHRVIRGGNVLPPSNISTIGVNAYLWHASLDVLSFMPLVQTDSAGGVIVTDWYANPGNPGERMKIVVTILDKDLRSDALRVNASRQVAQGDAWVDAPVQAATVQRLEDVILTKARELRRNGAVR